MFTVQIPDTVKTAEKVEKTSNFDMPLNRDRSGEWKLQNDGFAVATCLTSDFFIDEADQWRSDIWQIIKKAQRSGLFYYYQAYSQIL